MTELTITVAAVREALCALPRGSDGRIDLSLALAAVTALDREPVMVPRQRTHVQEEADA